MRVVKLNYAKNFALREKCPYSEFFSSVFSRIWTEYGEILRTFPYSVRMWKNTDQEISKYGHFSRSVVEQTMAVIGQSNVIFLLL